jgi:hypothetical protein
MVNRVAFPLLWAVLFSSCSGSPPPRETSYLVDFRPVFAGTSRSNSLVASGPQKEAMKRVLVAPSLVFESSRSSVLEPKTVGPSGATVDTPWREDALGSPVSTRLSSLLLRHLASKGSVLVTPVASRRLALEAGCADKACPPATWVERMYLASQRTGVPAEDLPSAVLGIQALGMLPRKIYVVVEEMEGGKPTYQVRPRKSSMEESECEDDRWIRVPAIAFSAEMVSLKDGRLMARIDEERAVQPTVDYRRSFKLRPVRNNDALLCSTIFAAYDDVFQAVVEASEQQLPEVVQGVLSATIDPLY